MKQGKVKQIINAGNGFMINCDDEIYQSKTVVLCTGAGKTKTVKGESELLGKGVSYCATCDGMLYRNKKVIYYSEHPNENTERDLEFLKKIGCDVLYHTKPQVLNEIIGNDKIEKVVIGGVALECDCLFIERKTTPITSLLIGLETEGNHIRADKNMETNIKGVFAAGDCIGKPYQLSKAIGEGLVAGQNAAK
jgi:thioredoxin reductase (NADPH)